MLRKIRSLSGLFRAEPTQFKEGVVNFLFGKGFDSTLRGCPDSSNSVARFRSLHYSLYKHMQKNVLAKAALTSKLKPRIVLQLYWCVDSWGGGGTLNGRFLEDMDVETDRKGWEHRVERHLEIMEEVAEDKQTNNLKCPKCGGLMIEKRMEHSKVITETEENPKINNGLVLAKMKEIRHPHYGEWFWGCLRYPECRGIRAYWIPEDQDKDVGNIMKDVPCPLCGNPMVIRMARRGSNAGKKFLGCVQYPICKGTLSREEALAIALMQK